MSEIVDFYSFLPNKNGITIDQVWGMTFDELDSCHNFIQYLFPTQEVSMFHPEAPLLTTEDIQEFREKGELREALLCSFELMLGFLGLEMKHKYDYNNALNSLFVEKGENYDERKVVWQSPHNHNYLRITRMLTCLMLCGLKNEAEAFLSCLTDLVYEEEELQDVYSTSYIYWFQAVNG